MSIYCIFCLTDYQNKDKQKTRDMAKQPYFVNSQSVSILLISISECQT